MKRQVCLMLVTAVAAVAAASAAGGFPKREEIVPPVPIEGNGGRFFAPYTQDDTIAEWVDVGLKAGAAGAAGGGAGQLAGQVAGEQAAGGVGGVLAKTFGGEAARRKASQVAIQRAGGWERIRETSDLSFDSMEELAAWLYVTKSTREDYKEVMSLVREIYPELKNEKYGDLIRAYHRRQGGGR